MIDPRILRLHMEVFGVPQMKDLDAETLDYFWYTIAATILCHRREWGTDAMLEHVAKIEASNS